MHHFFVKNNDIEGKNIRLFGEDRHHAVSVLRLKEGEELMISDEDGNDYLCEYKSEDAECALLEMIERLPDNHELPSEVWLFQGLPKSDKMELIIQKATELGAMHIVPMVTKNTVVKLEPKKQESKLRRWQEIARAAAKQSKRSKVPIVHEPMSFTEAVRFCESFDLCVIPYENEKGIVSIAEAIVGFIPGRRIAVFIGPEGGFDRLEVSLAEKRGIRPVSLGKRILRTETAAISMLSLIMIRLEIAESIFAEE